MNEGDVAHSFQFFRYHALAKNTPENVRGLYLGMNRMDGYDKYQNVTTIWEGLWCIVGRTPY